MKPTNHADPPDFAKLLPFIPPANWSPFWSEMGKLCVWLRYQWVGPLSNIEVTLRNVYPDLQVSPKAVYQGIMDEIERKEIPGVRYGETILHESGPFSPFRVYLRIRREFSEFFVCAAPVGTSFFVSVRTIDRFPHSKWFHYLLAALSLGILALMGFAWNGIAGALVIPLLSLSFAWSICRYATYTPTNWLTDRLPEIPVIGALYLRWFRPDTFYRQDIHVAFLKLVDGVIRKVVQGIEPTDPLRPQAGYGAPTP